MTEAGEPRAAQGRRPAGGQPLDARLAAAAALAWSAAWLGTGSARVGAVVAGVLGLAAALAMAGVARGAGAATRRRAVRWSALVALAVGAAAAAAGSWAAASVVRGPVDEWAASGLVVRAELRVTSDPRVLRPRPGPAGRTAPARVVLDAVVVRAWASAPSAGAGRPTEPRITASGQPVVVLGPAASWSGLLPGARVLATGRLADPWSGDRAARLSVRGPPTSTGGPPWAQRAAGSLRSGLREAARPLAADPEGLVPGLAVGDVSAMPPDLATAMRAAGLSHLTAVSGANVTLVAGAVLWLARGMGVRGRALPALAVLAVLAFVVVARPQPSVVRAAAMGLVALAAMGRGSRPVALPALAASVAALVVVDPWLARSYGFALSVLATLGLVLAAPRVAAAWSRWLPVPLAQALAVTVVAQAFVAPVVLLLQPGLSWVAVPANLLAAPAVAGVTWGGVAAAVLSPLAAGPAGWCAAIAGYPAGWIASVARACAGVPHTGLPWPSGGAGAAAYLLIAVLAMLAWGLRSSSQRGAGLRPLRAVVALALLIALTTRVELPSGWPPRGWVLVACSVGQGDALALNVGPGSAVVIDTGPDPQAVDSCLDDLGVRHVPVLVLSHFHADHVAGLAGVLDGRRVGRIAATPVREPADRAEFVDRLAEAAHIPVEPATAGERDRVGAATWEVLWPARAIEIGSIPNQSSLVLLVDVGGVRLMLAGDVEPAAQVALRALHPQVRADVLKVSHHGSRYQDPAFAAAVRPRLALVSVGARNDYGHPAAATLEALRGLGAAVGRTDRDGDLAVVVRPGRRPALVARGAAQGWHAGP